MPKGNKMSTEWTPNPRQLKMTNLLLDPEDTRTKTEKIAEVGVSRKTFYRWMKDPEYLAYLNSRIDQYTNAELAAVWRALVQKCKNGDVQAMKLFFDMKKLHPNISTKVW